MAVSSTAATACISRRDPVGFHSSTPKPVTFWSPSARFPTKPRRCLIRSSSDASPEAETATETESEESSVEASKVPYSLISALNVERVLRGIAITDADHYGRLGLQRGCPYDQVAIAYKAKSEELMNQGLDEEELGKKLELLKESYLILSSEEERRLYDWSLARSEKPERYVWPFEVDITQTPTQPPPPQEPEDVGPTRVVGYFLLGWLILSFTLSIALNR
ncbi:PREDICTED: NAD(P)H-quinone oxidoreductase subunit U, chloroplastic [Nelumbo nucifera]|uniref:NAD(P)H-quinone oxidoreductase subunit U, chloroplastic n=2 Tax=Nelumbo nucifera TaxID=4432 RepID=A0A822ZDM5_NELNU|nr:PREDICTED: NAD(P)H-quinone oxidoreductase subunit U, chloroplastic [Nelumbo nucifera]DAD44304.1 TPA_asm: hypothetical protein HUJ06_002534 [Nelumbo nucifera]